MRCVEVGPTLKRILEEYKGKVKLVVKFFPNRYKDYSRISALASCFAWREGKFERMHELLLSNSPKLDIESLLSYGRKLSLDEGRMKEAISKMECNDLIERDIELAGKLGIYATPAFMIGKEKIIGVQSYEQLKSIIERELKALKNGSP